MKMYKVILFCIFSCFSTTLWSQIDQGKVLLSGGIQYQKSGDFDQFSGGIGAAYFFSSNSAIGLSIGRGYEQILDFNPQITGEAKTTFISVYTRRYFSIANQFYFFLQPSVGYVRVELDEVFSGEEIEDESILIGLSPGFTFYPGERFGIEFSMTGLVYQFADSDSDEGSFLFDISPLSPSIGISFLLGKSTASE